MERKDWIDQLRGFAFFIVVLCHASGISYAVVFYDIRIIILSGKSVGKKFDFAGWT